MFLLDLDYYYYAWFFTCAHKWKEKQLSKFREGSRVRQTPEKGRKTYRPKRCGNNNKDEDNSPKTLNDKNQQVLSKEFRQLLSGVFIILYIFEIVSLSLLLARPHISKTIQARLKRHAGHC